MHLIGFLNQKLEKMKHQYELNQYGLNQYGLNQYELNQCGLNQCGLNLDLIVSDKKHVRQLVPLMELMSLQRTYLVLD